MKILRIAALLAAGLTLPQAAFAGEAEYAEMVAGPMRAPTACRKRWCTA
ncbi:hypothetical protein ACVWW3_004462 [Bradyrhizobium sp. LM2.9]